MQTFVHVLVYISTGREYNQNHEIKDPVRVVI